VLGRHGAVPPPRYLAYPWGGDELEHQPVGIGKGEDLLVEAPARALVFHAAREQPLDPVAERGRRHTEPDAVDLTGALASGPPAGPRKERQE
jgi:hypothetical protein